MQAIKEDTEQGRTQRASLPDPHLLDPRFTGRAANLHGDGARGVQRLDGSQHGTTAQTDRQEDRQEEEEFGARPRNANTVDGANRFKNLSTRDRFRPCSRDSSDGQC